MIGKAVAGMTRVERPYHRIARDFRKKGGRGDTGGFGIALDNRLLRDSDLLQTLRVGQEMLWCVPRSPWTARCIAIRPAQ